MYIHYGHEKFDPSLFVIPVNRQGWNKPFGGLWASEEYSPYGWKKWCEDEDFRICDPNNSFAFELSENARIFVIRNPADAEKLPRKEGRTVDFETFRKYFDVIDYRLSECPELYYALYSWDCDSILVLNPDVIVPVERVI